MAGSTVLQARRSFWILCGLTLLAKLLLATLLPITGDEAYFYWWGRNPAWGYYDHPPMIGWLMTGLLTVSDALPWLRLLTVLLPLVLALGLVDLCRRLPPAVAPVPASGALPHEALAWWCGSLFLLLPTSIIGIPVTNDTPLVLFACLSAYAFIRAWLLAQPPAVVAVAPASTTEAAAEWRWLMLSGVALGLAFLSKYFAVLMAVAYTVVLLSHPKGLLAGMGRILLIGLCALPFALENLAFNLWHCWDNIMFNAYNRNAQPESLGKTLPGYLGMMLVVLPPWLLWQLWAQRQVFANRLMRGILLLALVPLALLLLLSFKKVIGLHWVLAFLPLLLLVSVWTQTGRSVAHAARAVRLLLWSYRWLAGLAVVVLALLAAVLILPASLHEGKRWHGEVAFAKHLPEIAAKAQAEAAQHQSTLMATVYTPAAMLGYTLRQYVPVFGAGSFHARQDDTFTDFKPLAGQNLTLFGFGDVNAAEYAPFFKAVSVVPLEFGAARFWLLHGQAFDYAYYHRTVLTDIHQRYYRIPAFLPVKACPFSEKYGFPCTALVR